MNKYNNKDNVNMQNLWILQSYCLWNKLIYGTLYFKPYFVFNTIFYHIELISNYPRKISTFDTFYV